MPRHEGLLRHIEPSTDPVAERRHLGLRWWREAVYVGAFYLVYSTIRNQFGSAAVSTVTAFRHARHVITIERSLGLFFEPRLQRLFVRSTGNGVHFAFAGARELLEFWNVFYGTFHFVVTAVVLIWLFRRFPRDYPTWRNTLAFTTALALLGFSLYPLMPPRLLADCGIYGACHHQFTFVDTLDRVGGLWSFDSGTMQSISNQYAAMPSLHFAWSSWCFFVLFPRLKRPWAKALIAIYPWMTLWVIVVTANHYWLDAAGGALIFAVGYFLGSRLAAFTARRQTVRAGSREGVETVEGGMVGTPGAGYRAE